MGGSDEILRGWLERLWATTGPMKWPARVFVVSMVSLTPIAIILGILTSFKNIRSSPTATESSSTWSPATRASHDEMVFRPELIDAATVTLTSAVEGGARLDIRNVHPSGNGQVVLKNINANGFGGSVNIAAGDNGSASVTLDGVNIAGGSGPSHGGDVTIRAGNGGPNGPGGNMNVKGGSIKGGSAK
jgi:hypothetical protein